MHVRPGEVSRVRSRYFFFGPDREMHRRAKLQRCLGLGGLIGEEERDERRGADAKIHDGVTGDFLGFHCKLCDQRAATTSVCGAATGEPL
jgi:hypothetical protein